MTYTYKDLCIHANNSQKQYPQLRKGQCLMNFLHVYDPSFCKLITGTDADCFYFDEKIDQFKEAVEKHIEEMNNAK